MTLSIATKQKYKGRKKSRGLLNFTAHRLATALGAYVRTKQTPRVHSTTIINWGLTTLSSNPSQTIINEPIAVSNSSNKTRAYTILHNKVPIPRFTTSKALAREVIELGGWIVARKLTRASGGRGIVICKTIEDLNSVSAPLYTAYFRKSHEYRYHVVFGKVIFVQQKKRLTSEERTARNIPLDIPSYVRNLASGYIFANQGIARNSELSLASIKAVKVLGLDFGAVDILANHNTDNSLKNFVICEVNSAPGLSGSSFDSYVTAFKEELNNEST